MRKMKLTAAVAAGATALGLALSTTVALAQSGGYGTEEGLKVGAKAPDFTLTDAFGKEHTLSDYTKKGKVVVLEWFNSGCPFVKRHHDTYSTMADTAQKYEGKIQWIAINSGAPGKQGYGKDKEAIESWSIEYPILIDETGKVGHMYGAKTTPHMFIIDTKGTLVYAGAIDDDPRDSLPTASKTNYVDQALTELFAGREISQKESRPYGCSVKY